MPQPRTRIAAYVVCSDDRGRFLLARWVRLDGTRQWTLPGGGLDPGEHPEDGALRELTEETGHTGALDALLDVDTLYFRDDWYAVRVIYRGRVTGGALTAEVDGSTDLAQWFAPDEIATLDAVPLVAVGLDAARRPGRPLPANRSGTGPTPTAGAAALAVHAVVSRPDGRVLLVPDGNRPEPGSPESGSPESDQPESDPTAWDLPGGRAEHGEPLATAVRRLVAEVTGVEVQAGGARTADLDPDGTTVRITCDASTDVERPPVRQGHHWRTPDELTATRLTPPARSALDTAQTTHTG